MKWSLWQRRWAGFGIIAILAFVAACTNQTRTQTATPLPPMPTLDAERVLQGREVYQAHCATCHGANAEGAPHWATPSPDGLYPAPPHDDSGHTWHHSDHVLEETIRDGMGDPLRPGSPMRMPAFGEVLAEAEVRAVIAHFKSLWSEEHRFWQWNDTLKDLGPTPNSP